MKLPMAESETTSMSIPDRSTFENIRFRTAGKTMRSEPIA
jgi:hypothetical protein